MTTEMKTLILENCDIAQILAVLDYILSVVKK